VRELAVRLLAFETGENQRSEPMLPAAFQVCERLRPHLTTLMGQGGFRALLARAIAVAGADEPWLAALQVDGQGALEGWDKPEAQVKPKLLAEGGVLVVAHLVALLVAFIGDNLTLGLVRDVWPKVCLEDLHFTKRENP